ncbi:MAG: tRNA (guanosine(37)-N1)-methyltransferase TrmD [Bacilli bacterium]
MKIDILTLFPDMYNGFLTESIIKRAILNKQVELKIHNFRDYSTDTHHKVDDTPYGGGAGMVLTCQPIFDAVEALRDDSATVIMLTPDGNMYKESMAYDLAKLKHIILLCGHYEGFDERIRSIVDMEISIGDYILTGGELPSMVVADSIIRLLPGVIEEDSHINESFHDNLLDYPTYTKPANFRGLEVPFVLTNGNHADIIEYREKMRYNRTKEKRPDLLEK